MSIGTNEQFLKLRFGKYSAFFEGRNEVSLAYLATSTSTPLSTVTHELQQLINMGYFGSAAYINYLTKMLVLNSPAVRPVVRASGRPASVRRSAPGPTRTGRPGAVSSAGLPDVKKAYSSSRNLLMIGGIILFIIFVSSAGGQLDSLAQAGFTSAPVSQWWEFAKTGLLLVSGGAAFGVRSALGKRMLRFSQYRTYVGDDKSADIKQLAEAAGVSPRHARRDIEAMIEKGLWGQTAVIDVGAGKLLLSPEHPTAKPITEDKPEKPAASDSQSSAILKEIHDLDVSITDEDVSARIVKIEELTGKIFKIVEEKPEKLPQIKSFMSYYLPTTLKLLRSYNTFEKQGIAGENISSAKQDIERILDTLVKGFSQQLDQLFKDDAIDISTDIDVLESMMKRDGLSGEQDFTVAGGH